MQNKPHPQIIALVHATATEPAHVLVVSGETVLRVPFVGNSDLNFQADLAEHIRRKYGVHPLKPGES